MREARSDAPAPPSTSFELLEAKLRPPRLLAGNVERARLIELLQDSLETPLLLLSAPPGYGKTTLLAQWSACSKREFAWVTLDNQDNDPIVLLTYIAAALDQLSPLDQAVFEALASGASVEATVVPRLGSALSRLGQPFVLVLDDFQMLTNRRCLDVIDALLDHVPKGSELALSGQVRPSRRIGALRAHGLVLEIGPRELEMNEAEARALVDTAGVQVDRPALEELVQRTEGWPAGLYLAALSIRSGGSATRAIEGFSGDHRIVADYLRDELLFRLPDDELRFLTCSSILERMSAPLCDAVLEKGNSAQMLEALERSNTFVVSLDERHEWFRYHRLFRDVLRAELERLQPDLVPALLTRAAEWSEAHDAAASAVTYAQRAGDLERVARLIGAHGQREYQAGRAVTVEGWLGWLEERGALEANPAIAILGAWFSALRGEANQAERWGDAAERGAEAIQDGAEALIRPMLGVLQAAQCSRGVDRMRADAELAASAFPKGGPWWATAALLLGIACLLGGDSDRAEDLFTDVQEAGRATAAWNAASVALAERAMLAGAREDWPAAEQLAEEAAAVMRRAGMEEYPPNALVYTSNARVAAHRGEPSRAEEHLARAQRMRPLLTHVLGAFSIQTRLEMARVYIALGDTAGARTLLREAGGLLRRAPDFGSLSDDAKDLESRLESAAVSAPGASTLTTAELRVLPLLATHLSFREMGERLYLSHHTIKSHAKSIYRKLEVTSRNDAVERAEALGLL